MSPDPNRFPAIAAITSVQDRPKPEAHPDFFRVAGNLLGGHAADLSEEYEDFGKTDVKPVSLPEANVVTSRVGLGRTHKVAIDLDMDAVLIPTSTPGHHHLIIDHELTWNAYVKLLKALAEAGLVQQGFVHAAELRGYTQLRTPWTRKVSE